MPDQETQDFYNAEPEQEEVEQVQEEVAPAVPEPVAPPNQALISELREAQKRTRQIEEENHNLRNVMLQNAVIPQQNQDPIGTAMKKLESEMDPDAFKFTSPAYKLILQELHSMRQDNQNLHQENSQLRQTVTGIAQEARSRQVYTQLSQAIPDLDKLGPIMTEHLGKQSVEMQQKYINDPSLLVPLADAFRATLGTQTVQNVQGKRNKLSLDLGAGDRANPTTASDIQAMKPGSKEFTAQQNAFWGSTD